MYHHRVTSTQRCHTKAPTLVSPTMVLQVLADGQGPDSPDRTMAVATQQMPALPLDVGVKPTENGPNGDSDTQVVTITDLLLSKVRETPDAVFIQYPATAKGKSDYVGYTVTDVDRLADEAARQYAARGLRPEVCIVCGYVY